MSTTAMSNSALKYDPPIVIEPQSRHRASIIWMHGLGADGHDFENISAELDLPPDHGIRFIFPHAPVRPITINGGYAMRGWYDLSGTDFQQLEDAAGIRESARYIATLIDAEVAAGVPSTRILLAGFSQGGAMALQTGLRYPHPLAGLMVLSGYLPLAAMLAAEASVANQNTPIFMAHGTFDPVVPLIAAEYSVQVLQQTGYAPDYRTYPMPHSLCAEELEHIRAFISHCLPA